MSERGRGKVSRTRDEGGTGTRKRLGVLVVIFLVSVGAVVLFQHLEKQGQAAHKDVMLEASRLMQVGMEAIKACRESSGVLANAADDVNATGLIGQRYSSLTTTVGSLEAKRTSTNPNMAGLVAQLLLDAGARRGDAVAIGASGSFPALVLATLCAAKVLGLEPILIYSLGASQWGANELGFTWLEMEGCLLDRGILSYRVAALSLGGDADRATELDPATGASMRARAEATGALVVESPDLVENVRQRMAIYREEARGARIAAFVNVGGTWANIGTDPAVLDLEPGLDRVTSIPEPTRRGVLYEMAKDGIPIIHLLNLKGLVTRHGLPWDPVPLPSAGDGAIYHETSRASAWPLAISATYLALILALAVVWRRPPFGRRGAAEPRRSVP